MPRKQFPWLVAAALAATVLALPAISSANSFLPVPDALFLQKSSASPELGNAVVTLRLGSDAIKQLESRTGRTDIIALGPESEAVVFRDDGEGADPVKGDGEFSAFAQIDSAEISERGTSDRSSDSEGSNRGVPTFEGRALTGSSNVEPFDSGAFEAGERVPLSPGFSVSSAFGDSRIQLLSPRKGPQAVSAAAFVAGTNVFQDRVLMITDPLVVADPTRTFDPCTNTGTAMGPWTFGHLMTEMANTPVSGIDPSDFTETFLDHWLSNQTINSFTVPQRLAMAALIQDWRNAGGGLKLDLSIAPFRLLAINPRIDLRKTTGSSGGYGGASTGKFLDAGEARFTFGVVVPASYPSNGNGTFFAPVTLPGTGGCKALRFSVIFEYRVPKCECEDVRAWARAWIKLNGAVPGTSTYNGHLEKLTRVFTDANANPARPNGSAIGQVRTNEISLQNPWEIREFQLRMMPFSDLLETTTADTPDNSFQNTVTLRDFILNEVVPLGAPWNPPPIPLLYPLGSGNNFLGANPISPNPGFFWNAPGLNVAGLTSHNESRHKVSLGTCNGCHARETLTTFVHIDPATAGLPAALSGFLTGINVPDPAGGTAPASRDFDDLARRERDINAAAKMLCAEFTATTLGTATFAEAESTVSIGLDEMLRRPITQVH